MYNQCIRRLLGLKHEILAQLNAYQLGLQQFDNFNTVFEVWAGGVTEAVSAAAVALVEKFFYAGGIFAPETELLPHVFVPVFRQCLRRLYPETVQEKIILVLVLFAKRLGSLGGVIADGDKLETQNVKFTRRFWPEEIGDAKPPPAGLAWERKPHPLAR